MKKTVLFFLCFLVLTASHAKNKDWANAIYTNIQKNKIEGDLNGWRLQIIHFNLGNYILLQSFEGEPLAPCLAKAEIRGNLIHASLPETCLYKGDLSGVIGKNNVSIQFSSPRGSKTKSGIKLFLSN